MKNVEKGPLLFWQSVKYFISHGFFPNTDHKGMDILKQFPKLKNAVMAVGHLTTGANRKYLTWCPTEEERYTAP